MFGSSNRKFAVLWIGCLALACVGVVAACSSKESPTASDATGGADASGYGKLIGQPGGQPDLVVTSVVLSGGTTTACGGTLPAVTCGQKQFQVTIANQGTRAVAGGVATIQLVRKVVPPATGPDFPGPNYPVQSIIPVGGSVTMTYQWWMGPCEQCPIGFGPKLSAVHSTVDLNNAVAESDETNNTGPVQSACNQCG